MEEEPEEYYALTWKGHIQHVRDCFIRLLQSNDFCDVTLYAEGRKIGAHKVMLIASSGYFRALFGDLKDDRPIIVLKGVRFDILCEVLRFIYEGQVNIERAKLTDFIETANFLKIFGLIKDPVARKRTHSLVSETDNATNTGDGQTLQPDGVSKGYLVTEAYPSSRTIENHQCDQQNRFELSLTERLPKTKRYSLVAEADHSSRTTDNPQYNLQNMSKLSPAERLFETKQYGLIAKADCSSRMSTNRQYNYQNRAEVSPAEIVFETKQYDLSTETVPSFRIIEGQQCNQQNRAVQTLHEAKGYEFFQEKCLSSKLCSRIARLDSQANQSAPDPNLIVETKKYTLESPPRTGEWTSDYENHNQSAQSSAEIMMKLIPEEVDLDYDSSTVHSGNIKSESPVPSLEKDKETVSFNLDFASSPDAEIVLSDDDDDDDNTLEKEMLKTTLISVLQGGFQCNICNKIYVKKDSLKKHFTVHTRNTTCMICGITLSRRTHLQRHMKIHEIRRK